MPLLPTGTPLSEKITFNSGFLTIGDDQVVNLENVTVETEFDVKELRVINSIKVAALKRATFKCGLKGKIISLNKELLAIVSSLSSPDGSGTLYSIKDGQQDTINPVFTTYIDDDTSTPKVVQYQFTNAILRMLPLTQNTEDYGSFDFEMVASDVEIYTENA